VVITVEICKDELMVKYIEKKDVLPANGGL
jgi:hypothetical protein